MKGIIMSGNHPKLILDGIKTMTRRVIKPQPNVTQTYFSYRTGITQGYRSEDWYKLLDACPYGQVGDRLWVRETFWHPPIYVGDVSAGIIKKDNSIVSYRANLELHQAERLMWKPSIFMPRWASRITLEITEIRVERLQEITPLDTVHEGCPKYHEYKNGKCIKTISPIDRFRLLWDSLNAKRGYGWEVNPWVWIISFKVVK